MEQNYFEILMEEMNSGFKAVIEGHDSLRQELGRKIDDFRDEVDTRFKQVDTQILALNHKIDTVDAKLSKQIHEVDTKLSKRIDKLEKKVDDIATDLTAQRADTELHRAHG
ncbi:KID repeat-containing protein [Desulfurispirillum indicum S5]|uniref:KID repeat-containing protein n=1 Tax=Desulfurispirillum indicum (strain ATCC BAA-1389 / DSM 22839 / S5) TaxID=653733 RepID=E6W0L6_DESIS|nr:hypothetical protein [Desulfurispirillum indicum]ADU65268.1 KID repeat-containing protein [Desulfurispirillum indicum S5]